MVYTKSLESENQRLKRRIWEEENKVEEGDQEDTENGSKGIEKRNDDEGHVIDNIYF